MDNRADIGVRVTNGGSCMAAAGAGIGANPTDGTALYCDGGFFLGIDHMIGDGYRGLHAVNGSTLALAKTMMFSVGAGPPIETDATSGLLIGSVVLGMGAPSWNGYVIGGMSLRLWNGDEGAGTTLAPDQRPTAAGNAPFQGYRWWANDQVPGGGGGPNPGVWLTWNGANWIDTIGAVIP
jgi:hypothetical protein